MLFNISHNIVGVILLLQVLYYCPGLREGIKKLYNLSKRKEKPKEETDKSDEVGGNFYFTNLTFANNDFRNIFSQQH